MGDRTYAVDANNFLADGAAAMTASGYAQFGGADGIMAIHVAAALLLFA